MKASQQRDHRLARSAARERLVKAGHKGALNKVESLLYAIEVELGAERNCSPEEWIGKYLRLTASPAVRETREFRPLQPRPQWDINAERASRAQPKLWTPNAVGNGSENQNGYGRGR